MPVTLSIDVSDSATAAVLGLEDALGRRTYAKAVARTAAAEVAANFERLAAARHRGGPHNYYLTAARNTVGDAPGGVPTVTVYAPAGIALRRYGTGGLPGGVLMPSGRISAVTGKPIRAIVVPRKGGPAEGRVPLDFRTAGVRLRLAVFKRLDRAALVDDRPGARPVVYFWLLKSVAMEPDPSVLPADGELSASINRTLDRYAKGVWRSQVRRYTRG